MTNKTLPAWVETLTRYRPAFTSRASMIAYDLGDYVKVADLVAACPPEEPQSYKFGNPDDESLPLTQCACGATYNLWSLILSVYADDPHEMPCCGRRLYFSQEVHVREAALPPAVPAPIQEG